MKPHHCWRTGRRSTRLLSVVLVLCCVPEGCSGAEDLSSTSVVVTGSSLASSPLVSSEDSIYDVRDYGGVGDGIFDNTDAIQSAIDDASHSEGGGVVLIKDGKFLTGAIELQSNVYLQIDHDAILLASTSPSSYPGPWATITNSTQNIPVLIRASRAINTGVVGKGLIDGQAVPYFVHSYNSTLDKYLPVMWTGPTHYDCQKECRPRLIQFERCQNVLVKDITLRNSPDWNLHFLGCNNVLADGINIYADRAFPNNDGIDPDSSTDVTIRNCRIDTADDGICIKSSRGFGPANNIHVHDCYLRSRSSGFKIGSESAQDISNILVERVWIWDSNRALGLQHRDEGNVHDITFRDIVIDGTAYQPLMWWGAAEPIWVSTKPRHSDTLVGKVWNIFFQNITSKRSENGVLLSSRSGDPLQNVKMIDVHINIEKWHPPLSDIFHDVIIAPPQHDYSPGHPDHVYTPTDGIYMENVKDVFISQSSITFTPPIQPYWRDCMKYNTSTLISNVQVDEWKCTAPLQPMEDND